MNVKCYVSDLADSNMYLLCENGHALVIDPCRNTGMSENYTIDGILLTHEHYDHISGVNKWKYKTGAPVICSIECAKRIISPSKNMSRFFDDFYQMADFKSGNLSDMKWDKNFRCESDFAFIEKADFIWQNGFIHMFSLPGHSEGSIGILVNNNIFFSGDSLFRDMDTALRLPGGSIKKWREVSLPIIQCLDDEVFVYPGHGETFYIKERRV